MNKSFALARKFGRIFVNESTNQEQLTIFPSRIHRDRKTIFRKRKYFNDKHETTISISFIKAVSAEA